MSGPLPTVVIGGYLGAGKTTLVNHLLRHADGRRIAVLVNDFGDISIDAALIDGSTADADAQVMALAGGCICCSFGADLVGTLGRIAARSPAPDIVLIETSGVALPAAVARTARLAPGITVDGIVVLADAATLRQRAADRYVGDTVLQQLQAAQWLLLNKCDAIDAASSAALQAWLRGVAPRASVLPCEHAAVPAGVVLGLRAPVDEPGAGVAEAFATRRPRPSSAAADAADAVFLHQAWQVPPGVAPQQVADALAASVGLVRAKGLLRDADGATWLLQAVGSEPRLSREPRFDAIDGAPWLGRLQLIALRALWRAEVPVGWRVT